MLIMGKHSLKKVKYEDFLPYLPSTYKLNTYLSRIPCIFLPIWRKYPKLTLIPSPTRCIVVKNIWALNVWWIRWYLNGQVVITCGRRYCGFQCSFYFKLECVHTFFGHVAKNRPCYVKSNKVQSLFLKFNFNFNFNMRSMSWLSQNAHILLNENSNKQSLLYARAFSPRGEFHKRILQKTCESFMCFIEKYLNFLHPFKLSKWTLPLSNSTWPIPWLYKLVLGFQTT